MISLMTAAFVRSRFFRLSLVLLLLTIPVLAKDTPLQVIDWPATGTPVLRFTVSKFKQLDGASSMRGYVMNSMVENLSPRQISAATVRRLSLRQEQSSNRRRLHRAEQRRHGRSGEGSVHRHGLRYAGIRIDSGHGAKPKDRLSYCEFNPTRRDAQVGPDRGGHHSKDHQCRRRQAHTHVQ